MVTDARILCLKVMEVYRRKMSLRLEDYNLQYKLCGLVDSNISEEPAASISEMLMPTYCTKPWHGMPEECKVRCMDFGHWRS